MSKIGCSGSTCRIASDHCSHARVPQKSSTQRKPPLRRYSRSRVISSGDSPIVPTSDPTRNGHSNSASSVRWTVQYFASTLRVLADARLRQLRRPEHEVQPGKRIIRRPAEAVRFATVAGVHHLAYGEGAVAEVRRGHVERHAGPFHDPEPLSPGRGCRGNDQQQDRRRGRGGGTFSS